MKPDDWDDMTTEDKQTMARELVNTIRGRLILGQALGWAVRTMQKEQYPETSNIEDMEMLGEGLFQPFFNMYLNPQRFEPTK
jgi:hypothetical protein